MWPFLFLIAGSATAVPLTEIEDFSTVYQTVKDLYVDEIDEKTLMNYAIEGLVSRLDPHSDYLYHSELVRLEESTDGQFGGLGIELSVRDGFIEIMSVQSGSPADRGGLQSHDLILMIDHTLTQGMSLREASKLLRGTPGSEVTLSILNQNSPSPYESIIERQLIKNDSITFHLIDQKWGYIRIHTFNQETAEDFQSALSSCLNDQAEGIILDLRNNPGGLLRSSAIVANTFLGEDNALFSRHIVTAKGRSNDLFLEEVISGPDQTQGLPLVILINEGSASAAEIVAGALQDHKRAILIGEKTFGKGSVQIVLPIGENALKITCSRYFTPCGRSIQSIGITPDIFVMQHIESVDQPKKSTLSLTESSLNRHLSSAHNMQEKSAPDKEHSDPVVREGIRILTALSIQNERVKTS